MNRSNIDKSNCITYLSNAGVLIKLNDKKVLIDALCNSEIPIYKSTPVELLEPLVMGTVPFENIDLMLITHSHSDHFDSKSIRRFLRNNRDAVIVSTPQVISRLRQDSTKIDAGRLIELPIKRRGSEGMLIKGIKIKAMSMIHDGKEYTDVDNFAYLLEYSDMSVLHLGDAAPAVSNFDQYDLPHYNIDLLIANFPYIGIPAARQIVKELINPKKIAVVHLPYSELDRFGWIKAAKKSYDAVKDSYIPSLFLEDAGTTIAIRDR